MPDQNSLQGNCTAFIIIMAATPLRALATPEASACGYLAGLIDKAPPGPLFLPSYPTVESGPLHGAAYLYDNAVAAIALVGCGERDKARRIGAAILWAIDNDRTWHDGRLRNAYAAGVVASGSANFRVGGTILRTSGWKIDIRWAAIMATLHGQCWRCCRLTM